MARTLAELGTALEALRAAQEHILENRSTIAALQKEILERSTRYWELFDEMPDAYVVTRSDTTIVEVNRAAADLFNMSQRFLVGKALSVFVCEDRGRVLDESSSIAQTKGVADLRLKLRPRERAPLTASVRVRGDGATLRWILRPERTSEM